MYTAYNWRQNEKQKEKQKKKTEKQKEYGIRKYALIEVKSPFQKKAAKKINVQKVLQLDIEIYFYNKKIHQNYSGKCIFIKINNKKTNKLPDFIVALIV